MHPWVAARQHVAEIADGDTRVERSGRGVGQSSRVGESVNQTGGLSRNLGGYLFDASNKPD